MSEITGYIEVPFHGEKGESAYEIAVKYGYEGTEADWVESLGFIPDKSIGERKLTDALVGKLKEYETVIGEMFDVRTGYKEIEVNEYRAEAEKYILPYRLVGVSGGYKVKIPKIPQSVTVFDENDETLMSDPMSDYRFCKMDISGYEGEIIKIYGVANTTPTYPCAFCTDAEGNILERYGTDKNTIYGYSTSGGVTYTAADAITAVVPSGAKYLYISGRCFRSGSTVTCDAIAKAEVYGVTGYEANETYKLMQSPLWGKKLYVDGDSICYGNGYAGGYGKIIADRYRMELINNAVGGTTISAMGATNKVYYTDSMDWENNTYYLKMTGFDPVANKSIDGFAYPLTQEQYESGFGVYPTAYKMVDGVLTKLEYTETMPSGTFFVKFDVPTYEDYTIEKYYRMWSSNSWLWEAYKSGFTAVHEDGSCEIATARHWLSKAAEDVDSTADYIIFEGGINDYLMNRRIGEITADMTSAVDITTVIGGMEYMCRKLLAKCAGKKIVYIITPKAENYAYLANSSAAGYKTLTDYHDAILSVLNKYSIPCVDLFNNSALNTEIAEHLVYTKNSDGVHPTQEGYELFYLPHIISCMERI